MADAELRARYFREADASCRLEGLDSSGDDFYQAVKARVIAGEIDGEEMMRLLMEDSRAKYQGAELKVENNLRGLSIDAFAKRRKPEALEAILRAGLRPL